MSDTLVLFLPNADTPYRWLRIVGDAVAARGEGFPTLGDDQAEPPVVVAPAEDRKSVV